MRFCRLSLRREGVLGIGRSLGRLPVLPMYNFLQSYTVDDIGRSTGKMISDLNVSLVSQQFLNVANERTCFASCACVLKSSGLITCLECTSD